MKLIKLIADRVKALMRHHRKPPQASASWGEGVFTELSESDRDRLLEKYFK